MASILFLYGSAFITLAREWIIILRHTIHIKQGVFLDSMLHLVNTYLQHFGIRQANLLIGPTLAITQRKVFGVLLEILLWRYE